MKSILQPDPPEFASLWALDPEVIYFNHGSFGACPEFILKKQQEYQRMLEGQPVHFLIRQMEEMHELSRRKAALFVNSNPGDLVFVQNATTAVNTVFRSLRFNPGDEILITNHIYPACRRLLEYISEQTGAVLIEAWYGFPVKSPDVILESILSEVTPRTRIALIDHITSATAIIQPVEKIVKELDHRGVDVMIDGAHALGSIPLDLQRVGAAYYTANCHKWLCSPKSTAILHIREDRQNEIVPLVISHAGHRAGSFTERFYWQGTYDPSAAICVGDAIDYLGSLLPGGWLALMQRNHNLCLEARDLLCREMVIPLPCPDEMLASMATLTLPTPEYVPQFDYKSTDPFQDMLFRDFNIEVPFWYWSQPPCRLTRISAQLYNSIDQYRYLAEVLKKYL